MIRHDRRFFVASLIAGALLCGAAAPSLAANACSKEKIETALMGRKASQADVSLIERTCRESQKQERAAVKARKSQKADAAAGQGAMKGKVAVAQTGGSRAVPTGSGQLTSGGGTSEIHCGHHTCTCWNGNIINGCKLAPNVCADELTCIGPLCTCTAKD